MIYKAYPYQNYSTKHLIEHDYAALFLDMGLGKTVSTLTAIKKLMFEDLSVRKVLIIAPLFVADTVWDKEVEKWEHLKGLEVSKVLGTAKRRLKALRTEAHIYTINKENTVWLLGQYAKDFSNFPFDLVVIDELSLFKNHNSKRFKALKIVRPYITRVWGLTGTPAPNGLIDLWAPMKLLDNGERLGRFIGTFRHKYFYPEMTMGHTVVKYGLRSGADVEIFDKLKDICVSMDSTDYLELPEKIYNEIDVVLDNKTMKRYNEFKRDKIMEMSGMEITALQATTLITKLLQFSNGAVYDVDRKVLEIHDEKIKALLEIIENNPGGQVLVLYSFIHDRDRVAKVLEDKGIPYGFVKEGSDVEKWNRKQMGVLLAHPASCGHGLNLQEGGNIIVWFGVGFNLELYQQANARLARQGQEEKTVIIHHLLTRGTMDGHVLNHVLKRKERCQQSLLDATVVDIKRVLEAQDE